MIRAYFIFLMSGFVFQSQLYTAQQSAHTIGSPAEIQQWYETFINLLQTSGLTAVTDDNLKMISLLNRDQVINIENFLRAQFNIQGLQDAPLSFFNTNPRDLIAFWKYLKQSRSLESFVLIRAVTKNGYKYFSFDTFYSLYPLFEPPFYISPFPAKGDESRLLGLSNSVGFGLLDGCPIQFVECYEYDSADQRFVFKVSSASLITQACSTEKQEFWVNWLFAHQNQNLLLKRGGYYSMAQSYYGGFGVQEDKRRAIECWEYAADLGHELSIARLANLYKNNNDRVKARIYYDKLVAKGTRPDLVSVLAPNFVVEGLAREADAGDLNLKLDDMHL